jgi:anti-sigma factor RsiW
MTCHEATPLAQAYADGELDLIRSMDFEEHLGACPACSLAHQRVQELKKALVSANLYYAAPVGLRGMVQAGIGIKERRPSQARVAWWTLFKPAIPALAVAVLALLLVSAFSGHRLTDEIVASHVRSLMVDHRTDVASSDQHTVKPWFQGKIDFSPPVPDLSKDDFILIGGRLEVIHRQPAAAIVYRRRQHVIDLYVSPSPGADSKPELRELDGYHLLHWMQNNMSYWAVSDVDPADLRTFAALISGNN